MSNVSRVAVPVDSTESTSRPTLVPKDVWQSYQQELDEDLGAGEPGFAEDSDFQEVPSEVQYGAFTATVTADLEVARFALSRLELFAGLEESSLARLAGSARQGEVGAGEFLFHDGQPADCFYVVLDGALEVLRRREGREITLRQMERGEAIGLFGLLSGQTRAASARSVGDTLILEVPCDALNALIAEDSTLRERVIHFYEQRLLESFLGGSNLFAALDPAARAKLLSRFARRRLKAGDPLLQPGEVCNLFAVMITGQLMLELRPKADAGTEPKTFVLGAAEFVSVTSALTGTPSRMRIYAPEDCTLMALGHRELSELFRDHPPMRILMQQLSQHARQLDRDIFCGHTGASGL
jgi:CRP-like cAMP-binding protein